jgi:hypothetical protein
VLRTHTKDTPPFVIQPIHNIRLYLPSRCRRALIIRIGGGEVVDREVKSGSVEECLARIRQLEEENAHLREAAKTFGELAERLKRALDAQLRSGGHSASGRDRLAEDGRAVVDASQGRQVEDPDPARSGLAKPVRGLLL